MTDLYTLYQHYLSHRTICTDTRNILEGCLFFALKGDHFNANAFAEKAIDGGAAYVIIDEEQYQLNDRYLLVEDVLQTLQELSKHHRSQLQIPVIGLTGSNGKTTTKELINAVLSTQYNTFATKGNLNNHIGVPLSLLSITDDIEIAVIEMGANHQKEIEFLCTLAQPTHGMITNVGMAHLDGFGGFEGVKKGKAELFAYLNGHQGFTFVSRDNPDLMQMNSAANPEKVIFYGKGQDNLVTGKLESSDPLIEISWSNQSGTFHTSINLTGSYNFENILAAVCIGQFFEVSPENINNGLSGYNPVNNRSQVTKTEKNVIICDFYNANPSSMAAALSNLDTLSANHKVAILGDMFELGEESSFQHKYIIDLATQFNLNALIFIGKHFYALKKDMSGQFFITPKEAEDYLKSNPIIDSLVLLKGSRGMALEQLLPLL
jgi:UDP-N-acetylmuramoyl-tripeptide--D-alanyl-D-alanine ligase